MEYYLGCSGWNYGDNPEKGGWLDIFYLTKDTKRLRYYSEFFNTVKMDSIFYEEFYFEMTKGLFFGLVKATPQNFEFSIKVPERITHRKKLELGKDVISPLLYKLHEVVTKEKYNEKNKCFPVLMGLLKKVINRFTN